MVTNIPYFVVDHILKSSSLGLSDYLSQYAHLVEELHTLAICPFSEDLWQTLLRNLQLFLLCPV